MIVHLRLADTYTSTQEPHSTRGGSKTVVYSNSYYIIDILSLEAYYTQAQCGLATPLVYPTLVKKKRKKRITRRDVAR
jgi:hypothetical protein